MQSFRIIGHPESKKIIIEKKVEKLEFPMLHENWPTFSITVNKYFLPLQSNFFVKFKGLLHFISQNLEAIDRPVPVIKKKWSSYGVFA